ncbi:MAG TPA: pentapeptide repeat-containing protein [Pyrinomonadaceae bacterium]|nr:pentapeptide repeat-containing protein [Pyrinomonadaceae bacterium]
MFKDVPTAITTIAAVLTGVLGVFKYFQYKTRRDKIMAVRQSFEGVVKSLASKDDVERSAGAILLRRFFDHRSEVGIAGKPYWKAAVDVSAAILRNQERGNFQKLLADGLAYAPSLERTDLQRTNLQFAYLGARDIPRPGWYRRLRRRDSAFETIITDLSYADFYRADLSHASLRRARVEGAVFYQARMHHTVLRDANLQGANFYEADLRGANFKGAHLKNANFFGAKNLPEGLKAKLDEDSLYKDDEPFKPEGHQASTGKLRIFVSKPGILNGQQQHYLSMLKIKLEREGMIARAIERSDYPNFGTIGEIQRAMDECVGAVVLAFKQLEVRDGSWRSGTPEEKQIKGRSFSSPWNQIEAGMAAMLNIPILVLCQRGIDDDIFDPFANVDAIHRAFIDEDWEAGAFSEQFQAWCAEVSEHSQTSTNR